jgi:hypothetical protein
MEARRYGRRLARSYRREIVPRITSLRERLLKEVWKSVDLGLQCSPIAKGDLTVHIDANPVVAHKSSQYVQELVGLVVGRGPGLQGPHQAGELGCLARRGSRRALAGEAAAERHRSLRALLRRRSTAGQRALNPPMKVRVLPPQPSPNQTNVRGWRQAAKRADIPGPAACVASPCDR